MSEGARRWLELSARATSEEGVPRETASALLVEALLALGGRSVEERGGWIVTYLEPPPDLEAFLGEARRALHRDTGTDRIELRVSWRAHEEWSETWKRGLGPRRVTDRIVVHPSWDVLPGKRGEVRIVLDPGMAFGTAEHGTTRGCLRLLDRTVREGEVVLDVGSGSGILAIAAALLGASACVAIEADLLACEALRENLTRNGVGDRVRPVEDRVGSEELGRLGPVDGVVANIETGVLEELMPGFVRALRREGWLILSGIPEPDWPSIRATAEAAGVRFIGLEEDEGWISGLFRRAR